MTSAACGSVPRGGLFFGEARRDVVVRLRSGRRAERHARTTDYTGRASSWVLGWPSGSLAHDDAGHASPSRSRCHLVCRARSLRRRMARRSRGWATPSGVSRTRPSARGVRSVPPTRTFIVRRHHAYEWWAAHGSRIVHATASSPASGRSSRTSASRRSRRSRRSSFSVFAGTNGAFWMLDARGWRKSICGTTACVDGAGHGVRADAPSTHSDLGRVRRTRRAMLDGGWHRPRGLRSLRLRRLRQRASPPWSRRMESCGSCRAPASRATCSDVER